VNWFDAQPISQIHPRLFVSGQAQANHLAQYNPHGITAVLNLHHEPDIHLNPKIVYEHEPFPDGAEIPPKAFLKCMRWLKAMYDAKHTILIHCAAGISRSVTVTCAFMHYHGLMEFSNALNQVKTARPIANPAVRTLNSAKRMLGAWPYDGSVSDVSAYEKMIAESFQWMDAERAAEMHPAADCPMREFLLNGGDSNTPRHEIPCTCLIVGEPNDGTLL
jgi:protein-tyrosine phosphatase